MGELFSSNWRYGYKLSTFDLEALQFHTLQFCGLHIRAFKPDAVEMPTLELDAVEPPALELDGVEPDTAVSSIVFSRRYVVAAMFELLILVSTDWLLTQGRFRSKAIYKFIKTST